MLQSESGVGAPVGWRWGWWVRGAHSLASGSIVPPRGWLKSCPQKSSSICRGCGKEKDETLGPSCLPRAPSP